MSVNWDWVNEQLVGADVGQEQTTSLKRLLEVIDTMRLNDDQLRMLLDNFHKLAVGHSIVPDRPGDVWTKCIPGHYAVGNTVRVLADAYAGEKSSHNGKRGRVCAVRGGMAVVIYDNASSSDEQYYHRPESLERLL